MRHVTVEVPRYSRALGIGVAIAISAVAVTQSAAQSSPPQPQKAAAAVSSSSNATPLFGIKIPPGYRDWRLVSVAHEEGNLNDLRAILGNDLAIKAYREKMEWFPDGAIIARIAWKYVPSKENDKVFGKAQSFVPGSEPEWYLQFMVKDSKKYAATGGWGYAQFDKNRVPVDDAKLEPCSPCHEEGQKIGSAHDFVFTRYTP
jgi:hypothetical protein